MYTTISENFYLVNSEQDFNELRTVKEDSEAAKFASFPPEWKLPTLYPCFVVTVPVNVDNYWSSHTPHVLALSDIVEANNILNT